MNRIRRYIFIIITGWFSILIGGNPSLMKIDAGLRHMLYKQSPARTGHPLSETEEQIWTYILAEGSHCQSAIHQAGGRICLDLGNMVSAKVPSNALSALMENPGIRQLCLPHRYHHNNDRLTADIRADQVYAGLSPLPQSYTGAGVIIGIIDTGIDITHSDFKKSDGKTRILSIWDQNISGSPPSGYDYGTEWSRSDINNGLCTHKDDTEQGHGTHVAGIAAGNGRAIGKYRGVSPEADLIVVADNKDISGGFIDAVNYIYDQADALGMPCVINASLGSHQGGHDGTDLESRMLNQLISGSPGRALCASAGNEGNDYIHMSYTTSADSFYTYVYPGSDGIIMLYIRLPNDILTQVHFAIGWDTHDFNPFSKEGGPIEFGGRTPWFSVLETLENIGFYERAETLDGQEVGRVSFEFDTQNDEVTVLRIMIEDDVIWDETNETAENMDLWRFMIWQPDDRVDAWIGDMGYSYPGEMNDPRYLNPDNKSCIGVPALANNVIAVGASVNRETFVDQFGDTWIYSEEPAGSLAAFSSRGPTADGRIKPDLIAPGDGVISALSAQAKNGGDINTTDIVQGGKHVISSGTSMSCPAVTGCIALYLQRYPNATHQQIYNALTGSARQDDDTGIDLPNNEWGYGKADAFVMLTHGTDIQQKEHIPLTYSLSQNYPNPFNHTTQFLYSILKASRIRLMVQNCKGQCVFKKDLGMKQAGDHRLTLDGPEWTTGVYIFTLTSRDWRISKKMVLMK
ncbi:S8 family serine peptidase [bacterium]|nr:S8 family serine peptidase [bacterium]